MAVGAADEVATAASVPSSDSGRTVDTSSGGCGPAAPAGRAVAATDVAVADVEGAEVGAAGLELVAQLIGAPGERIAHLAVTGDQLQVHHTGAAQRLQRERAEAFVGEIDRHAARRQAAGLVTPVLLAYGSAIGRGGLRGGRRLVGEKRRCGLGPGAGVRGRGLPGRRRGSVLVGAVAGLGDRGGGGRERCRRRGGRSVGCGGARRLAMCRGGPPCGVDRRRTRRIERHRSLVDGATRRRRGRTVGTRCACSCSGRGAGDG